MFDLFVYALRIKKNKDGKQIMNFKWRLPDSAQDVRERPNAIGRRRRAQRGLQLRYRA